MNSLTLYFELAQQSCCANWQHNSSIALGSSSSAEMGVTSKQQQQRQHVAPAPPPLVHALSGAVGAVIAMALLYPLDQVRAILQVCLSSYHPIIIQLSSSMSASCISNKKASSMLQIHSSLVTLYAVLVAHLPDLVLGSCCLAAPVNLSDELQQHVPSMIPITNYLRRMGVL